MRKTFYYLILIFIIISCSKNKPEFNFLIFYLGMPKSEFLKTRDTLVKQKKIKYGSLFGEKKYTYYFEVENHKVKTNVRFEFDMKELSEIKLKIGESTSTYDYASNKYLVEKKVRKIDILNIYNLYVTKYGKPEKTINKDSKNQISEWNFDKYTIRINTGFSEKNEDKYSLRKNAEIEYKFKESYILKRRNKGNEHLNEI